MIVSHRHRFIFFAVPRTGTHAIRAALAPLLGPEDWQQEGLVTGARSPLPPLRRIGHGHISLRLARPHLPEVVWRSYFKFAFVRDPYDRFVSACAMMNKRNAAYAGNETAVMKYTLNSLKGAVGAADFRKLTLARPQAGLLADEGGRIGVDFVGRYEDLQESFAQLCRRIGIPVQPLPVVNAVPHRPYREYYDDELRRLVTGFYRRDFELLGYRLANGEPLKPASAGRRGRAWRESPPGSDSRGCPRRPAGTPRRPESGP